MAGLELQGKVAVITGAGSGIGRGIARVLASEGAEVIATDVVLASAEAVASECGGRALAHDVTRWSSCRQVVARLWDPLLDQLAATKEISRDEAWQEFVDGIPLGRPQEPEDIGEVVAFLASERAHNMTGQGVNVTGGMQLH